MERLIATARAVLAVFALLSVWLDPTQPARHAQITYSILLIYAGCSAILAGAMWQRRPALLRLATPAQLADPLAFMALIYFTEGPASPFFLLFIFSVLGAMLKWGWRGALWMSVVAIAINLATAAAFEVFELGGDVDLQRLMLRTANLAVAGAMLVYFGLSQERIAQGMLRLAAWPDIAEDDSGPPIREALAYAAEVFGADRALLAWRNDDGSLNVADWNDGAVRRETLADGAFDPVVQRTAEEGPFLYDPDTGQALQYAADGGLVSLRSSPLSAAFCTRFGINRALCLPVRSDVFAGWLFLLEKPNLVLEELLIGSTVATQIAARMEHWSLASARTQAAEAEGRLRLARDIHDSVLQSLAGAALQIEGLLRDPQNRPMELRDRLAALRDRLISEQRDIRAFIGKLRAQPARAVGPGCTEGADYACTEARRAMGHRREHRDRLR